MAGALIHGGRNGLMPSRRVVLLGASNLVRGLPTIVETACRLWGRPLDVLGSFGHGRSYGLRKSLLWRELPGITECGLWEALAQRPAAPTAALVTDIGNDLLYEVSAAEIAGWVEECIDRLQSAGATVVLTALPLCSIGGLSARRFLFYRRLLFPACPLRYETVVERALELDQRLRGIAWGRGVILAEFRANWYGLDPIHIRRRAIAAAWHQILSGWAPEVPGAQLARPSIGRWARTRFLAPHRRWVFGRERITAQPVGRLADGTTLALY